MTVIIDPAAVGAVANLAAEDADRGCRRPAAAGNVVVDDPRHLDSGQVTLAITTITSFGDKGTTKAVTAPGVALPHRRQALIAMMTKQTARSLGLGSVASVALATTRPRAHRRRGGPPPGRARRPARQRARDLR